MALNPSAKGQREQRPADRDALLRAVIDTEPECVKLLAADGTLLEMNPAGLAMIEAESAAQVIGRDVLSLVAPEHRPAFAELTRAVFRGEAGKLEFEIVGLKGTRRWLETHAVPLRAGDGTITALLSITRDVTERKRAEAALGASQARLQGILDAALDAFVMIDADGRITSWSPQAETLFGWPAADALGRALAETVIPRRYRGAHLRGLVRFLATGEGPILGRRIEITALHRSGREFPVELAVTPLRHDDRWLFSAFVRDITARKQAEQLQAAVYRVADAAQTTRSLEDLLKAIHGIVGELMPARNFYIALYDAAAGRISFPYFVDEEDTTPAPKQPGRGLTEYVLRTGRPLLATPEVHEALERRGEVELVGAASVDWLGVPLTVGDKTIGVVVVQTYTEGVRFGEREQEILHFVSTQVAMAIERKRAEERLRDSERRFRALIEHSSDAIALFGPDGAIRYGSPATTRVLGYALDEFVGRNAFEFIHPDDQPLVRERLTDALQRPGAQVSVHARVRHQDGSWHLLQGVFTNLLDDPDVGAIVNNYYDITESRRLEDQLRQAQKMEAVGRLAGGLAHDFNNILTAIAGYSDLLLEDLPLQDPRREDVEEIRKAAERAAALTRQLLAFSRRQVLQPKVIDLNAVVASAEKLLRRLIGEDVTLATRLEPALWAVRADPGQIEQVIVNLAVNARDAMPQGGQLTIETANTLLDQAYADEHQPVTAGEYVMLAVTDTGIGMDKETQAHIFEPFFTTKERGKGTGLGLAMVYGIVKQSGGFIWVYSEPEQGTTFKSYLPRVVESVEAAPSEPARAPRTAGSETILLAEDEEAVRRVARETLTRHGYTVLQAPAGAVALALAGNYQDAIHLLLTDVVMPGMSGRQLADRLTALRPGLKVLYMSGYTDDAIVREGRLEPGLAYLQKPFRPDALARKVREVLDAP
ncbi:MAG: PAS domain S-box protein [Gemmatimonadetes bacterium]|nr:PAS domain S-box protein [Gemmatimonadota bacterium]